MYENLLQHFLENGPRWIKTQRDKFFAESCPLPSEDMRRFSGFFSVPLLEAVRVAHTDVITNPDFYPTGQPPPLDFRRMQGITYIDTIVFADMMAIPDKSLLFHEIVHVVQYTLLGVDEFVRRYVYGWAKNGFMYEAIPLEYNAYQLQYRYTQSPASIFSVEDEVRRQEGY